MKCCTILQQAPSQLGPTQQMVNCFSKMTEIELQDGNGISEIVLQAGNGISEIVLQTSNGINLAVSQQNISTQLT